MLHIDDALSFLQFSDYRLQLVPYTIVILDKTDLKLLGFFDPFVATLPEATVVDFLNVGSFKGSIIGKCTFIS